MNAWTRNLTRIVAAFIAMSVVGCVSEELDDPGKHETTDDDTGGAGLNDLPDDYCKNLFENIELPNREYLDYRHRMISGSCDVGVSDTYETATNGLDFVSLHLTLQEGPTKPPRGDLPIIDPQADAGSVEWEDYLRSEDRSNGCMGPEGDSVVCSTDGSIELQLFEFEFLAYYENIQVWTTVQYWSPLESDSTESKARSWAVNFYRIYTQDLVEAFPRS